jgi:FAD synthase
LRDERRYAGPEALFEQIQKDIRRAREILNGRKEGGGG